MSAIKSILLAIQVATSHRDSANKNLFQIQRSHKFAQNQMDQLESYAQDSSNRWIVSAQICTVPELMQHHYQFMGRLQHAIDLQRDVIAGIEQQVHEAKKIVLQAEYRLSGLVRIFNKRQADEHFLMSRREQQATDDMAATMHRRNSPQELFGDRT